MKARSELARRLSLLAAPLVTLLLFLFTSKSPLHVLEFPNPDFGYLFSSLALLNGETPSYVDHPGTPLQLLGVLLLFVRYLFSSAEGSLATHFFLNPVSYQQFVMHTCTSLFLLAQWFCGYRLRRLHIPLTLCIFSQLCPLLIWDGLVYLDHVSAETLLAAAGLCLIPLLAESSYRDENHDNAARAIAVGVCLGLMVSLKAPSFPLLFSVFLLRRNNDRIFAAGSFLAFFLCITASIWPHFPRMLGWYTILISRGTVVGQGAQDPASDTDLLLRIAPLLVSIWFLFFSRFLQIRDTSLQRRWPLMLSGTVMILLVLRHPASRYFLPLCFVVSLAAIQICRQHKWHRFALAALAVVAALYAFPNRLLAQVELRGRGAAAIAELSSALSSNYSSCHLTILDEVGVPAFTLFAGGIVAKQESFGKILSELYPQVAFRKSGSGNFLTFEGPISDVQWAEAAFSAPCRIVAGRQNRSEDTFKDIFQDAPVILERAGPGDYLRLYGFSSETESRLFKSANK